MNLLRLMQRCYESTLWKTLQKDPASILEGLAWSTHYKMILSPSRHCQHKEVRRQNFGLDLIHIPYQYDLQGKRYVNRAAEILMI